MKAIRIIAITVVAGAAVCVGTWLWWLYGSPLSNQTAYRLAVDHAQKYAAQEGIDLDRYAPPEVGLQSASRLYEYSWKPKDGKGFPLTIIVDSQIVDVSVVQSPKWENVGAPQ